MNYIKVSVTKPGNIAGRGGRKLAKITFIDMDDVLYFPPPDSKGIVITDNIIFKANCYAITVYATPNSIKLKNASSGEIDAKGVKQTVIFNHPGSETEILEFRTAWLDRNILIVVEKCGVSAKDLYGSPCNPLQFNFEHDDDNEKNVTAFTLESTNIGPDMFKYMGTLTLETVTGTVAADETEIDLTNGPGQYQLTTGGSSAATITTCTDAVHEGIYTLLGSGGAYPSIITAANDFVLENGTQWTAAEGASITFQAFKDGASSWKFFELSRTV